MQIAELTAFHAAIPLRRTIRHASHTRRGNDALIVRCRLDDGTEGWGEGLPRPYVTGETIETACDQLHATDLPAQLGGSIDGLREAIALCDRLTLAAPPVGRIANPSEGGSAGRIGNPSYTAGNPSYGVAAAGGLRDCFGNSVRCAVELSILDAVARAEGRPLSDVTQLVPETVALRAAHDRVRYSAAITSMGALKQTAHALFVRLYGFEHVKVKVGTPGIDDARSLARVRRWAGRRIDLRIDANEGWTCETLEARLAPLRPFGISAVEQPVPHAEVDGLAAIRPRLGLQIILDESLCSRSDAERAIERGLCDVFNIRLSKCGGFLSSLRLAALAHRAGLGFQLGCLVGETGILSAAGRHFACSVDGIRYVEGSFDRYLVREPLTVEDLTFGRGGWAAALRGPGLGVEIDRQAIKRVAIAEHRWPIAPGGRRGVSP